MDVLASMRPIAPGTGMDGFTLQLEVENNGDFGDVVIPQVVSISPCWETRSRYDGVDAL